MILTPLFISGLGFFCPDEPGGKPCAFLDDFALALCAASGAHHALDSAPQPANL
jgi:hypothetical protein